MKTKRSLTIIAGLIIGLGVGILIFGGIFGGQLPFGGGEAPQGSDALAKPVVGAPAPDFELTSLSGESRSLTDYGGQVVLLNFWATWCGPCRLEMPEFQERSERFEDQLAVVAVNFDENPADVQSFVNELSLTFDILLDPGAEVQRLYQVRGYPTSFFIDKEGIIRIQHVGLMTEEQLNGYLSQLNVQQN